MNINKTEIIKNVYLLQFEKELDMSKTFIRFQEYYESPKFKNKIFTLSEYKEWYIKEKGQFSYYYDWGGFNIPSYILKPFYNGKFNPLSHKEKILLKLFKNINNDFYIISVCNKDNLIHELAHALFYTNKQYKKEVINILKKFNMTNYKNELFSIGYHNDVLLDEIHAYALEDYEEHTTLIPKQLNTKLKTIFNKYINHLT